MKNILFVIPELTHGGTNKSLENMLSLIDKKDLNILIYSFGKNGCYKKILADYNMITCSNIVNLFYCLRLIGGVIRRIDKILNYKLSHLLLKKEAKTIQHIYRPDIVIAFQEGLSTKFGTYFSYIHKIAWVQCDYSLYLKDSGYPFEIEQQMYSKYNKIICVSKCCAEIMKSVFPSFISKIFYIYNLLNIDRIVQLSLHELNDNEFDTDCFTLISIGRFSWVKRFESIPYICSVLNKATNRRYKWYIIGAGEETKQKTEQAISKYAVESNVIILGPKNNPYPYLRKSNLLVCLSVVESWSYVINEAKLLHVPVVSTDFAAALEVVDNNLGVITSYERISEILIKLINDEDKCYTTLQDRCMSFSYSNNSIIDSVEKLLIGE